MSFAIYLVVQAKEEHAAKLVQAAFYTCPAKMLRRRIERRLKF